MFWGGSYSTGVLASAPSSPCSQTFAETNFMALKAKGYKVCGALTLAPQLLTGVDH